VRFRCRKTDLFGDTSFLTRAGVLHHRFVPALNVLAIEFNIPDDVAGATLMAAGASSPELFSSIVSLFVTHSALGLGTIVGSEIFNQASDSLGLDCVLLLWYKENS